MEKQILSEIKRCNATLSIENVNSENQNRNEGITQSQYDKLNGKIDILMRQNCKILTMMKQILKKDEKQFFFPLQNIESLRNMEKDFTNNAESYELALKSILQTKGVVKSLTNILHKDLVKLLNYDGCKGKEAFKSFRNIDAAIYQICKTEGYDLQEHGKQMRKAFKLAKGRIYKNESNRRKDEAISIE